ncbi:hypothetical protein MIT9_P1084 [Methylomarinovum caldicuralii]|uniref:Uncharacterized protein n=1 Tax=Methylomarinovum caldicuralii TaxID=438856 RepID=A0AAU9BSH7_9GAMM|nr:hypothetical protein [Methylomarinovum caldicuralii]BCX81506.1 hypothetical protein MIT9_P1084 [Methylomarinovum caldicuralii]
MRWLVWLCLLWLQVAVATSVREATLEEMLRNSELVFRGEVIGSEIRDDGPRPYTRITFRIEDVIKGDYEGATLALDFAGAPARGLRVDEMRYPQPGERGIYFVESLRRRQANPLYGWSQGHFRIVARNGRAVVVGSDSKPVVAVTGSPKGEKGARRALSRGVPKGVQTESRAWNRGLAPEQFEDLLRQRLEALQP